MHTLIAMDYRGWAAVSWLRDALAGWRDHLLYTLPKYRLSIVVITASSNNTNGGCNQSRYKWPMKTYLCTPIRKTRQIYKYGLVVVSADSVPNSKINITCKSRKPIERKHRAMFVGRLCIPAQNTQDQ